MAKLEDLQELAKAVHRNKVKNIHVIGNNSHSPTVFDEFYYALLDEKFETDEEYARYFYGENLNLKAYYKLKDRLQERLINMVFFVDVNGADQLPIQKAYYSCYKNAYASRILIGKGLRKPTIRLAEKTLKISIKFELTEITLHLARLLRVHYSTISCSLSKVKYLSSIINKYQEVYRAELLSEGYYTELIVYFQNSNETKKFFLEETKDQVKKIKKLIKKFNSYKLNLTSYLLFITYYECTHNHAKVLKTSNKAIKLFEDKPHLINKTILINFLLKKMAAHFILRSLNKAEKIIEKCIKIESPNNFNWLIIIDFQFRIYLHSHRFENAKDVFDKFSNEKISDLKFTSYNEIWKINEAFIHYLIRIGKIPSNEDSPTLRPFRLARFLNEVPTYSKDKRGSNITILILQVLFLLEDKKYDVIIDRTESLKVYTQRYLKDDDTFRSNCFIKMLLCLPTAGFRKEKVEQKAKKYLDHLHSVPIEKAKQSAELEVMPYEMLWEFVLESLER